jgi:hypothetical protein
MTISRERERESLPTVLLPLTKRASKLATHGEPFSRQSPLAAVETLLILQHQVGRASGRAIMNRWVCGIMPNFKITSPVTAVTSLPPLSGFLRARSKVLEKRRRRAARWFDPF